MTKGKSIEEAIALLEGGGVTVLRVEYTIEDAPTLTFENDGIAAILGVQQVGKLVCFAHLQTLKQGDFEYMPQNYRDAALNVESEPIVYDLSLDPKLRRFKHYIDQPSVLHCSIPYAGCILVFEVKEPWYDEYLDALEVAEESALMKHQVHLERLRLDRLKNLESALVPLKALKNNSDFVAVARRSKNTLKAIVALARSLVPLAFNSLGETKFKLEVSNLIDEIRLTSSGEKSMH